MQLPDGFKIPQQAKDMFQCFRNCQAITETPDMTETVNEVNMNLAFYNCTGLKKVTYIPDNVKSISSTFYGCTSLSGTVEISCATSKSNKSFPETVQVVYRHAETCDGTCGK
jgi:hypothetical protein